MVDFDGNWAENIANTNKFKTSSTGLPKTGDPNSSQTKLNPDGTPKQKRWYGPDGNPIRDRDYNHNGDVPFPHDHEWKDGKRGKDHLNPSPEYEFSFDPVIGVGLIVICALTIVIVAADDLTLIGAANNFLLAPLSVGISKGLSKLLA